ncbi:CDP-alcohol phosphatidyltransferase family protein [Anaerolineales bacterium HSG6]|nr:CDP-alcohol phosphatidyltransferase family protein [Anaerolineales bacterium HSG6]
MLDNMLRGFKDRLLASSAAFIGTRFHPIQITLLAFFFGLIGSVALTQQFYWVGFFMWWVNRFLDGLDGTVARQHGLQTDLGGYLDILFDFVMYAAFPIALVIAEPTSAGCLAVIFLLATFYVNAASWMYLSAILEKHAQGAKAQGERTTITMPGGLITGAETVLFYCAFILFPAYLVQLYLLMAGLVIVTIIQRFVWAVRHLD